MELLIVLGILFLWMIYAYWSAPLMQENEDGSFTTLRPERKISDIFKKKSNPRGSYSDLEKKGRGRSKY
jgi:hypothetical protein